MKNELDMGSSLDQVTKWLPSSKVTLRCNECGKSRKVSADGNYNERCPKCGGVDWDVVECG